MSKSTSIHQLNADTGLGRLQKYLYLFLNRANNAFPNYGRDKKLHIKDFMFADFEKHWNESGDVKMSPSRRLSNLFWYSLPWDRIQQELGEIHIFDTGCGKGRYSKTLLDFSDGRLASYTGVDLQARPDWMQLEQEYPNFHFKSLSSDKIITVIPPHANMFISQSAIEHFVNDLDYFAQIRDYVSNYRMPVIQFHLFPSSACLQLYGWHGVRQYTPRTVSKITRRFRDFSTSTLFNLGGQACNELHYNFITKPIATRGIDLRDTLTLEYDQKLREAIRLDMQHPLQFPNFYALVIHSYPKNTLL